MDSSLSKLNLFIAYAREDIEYRERLDKHLTILKRDKINTWHDGKVEPGQEWEKEISEALSNADIILLLFSVDFIASEYCFKVEMEKALKRHESGQSIVIPIILTECEWKETPFFKIQALPNNGLPISSKDWGNKEDAFWNAAQGIKRQVLSLLDSKVERITEISKAIIEKELEQMEKEEIIDNLQKQLSEKTDELVLLEDEILENQSKLKGLLREVDETKNNIEKLKEINGKHQILIDKARKELKNLTETEVQIQKKVEEVQKKLDNLNAEAKRISNELYSKKK